MKNIVRVVIFFIMCSYSFAQVYPLNTLAGDIPDYGYIKDVNGELNQYLGIWKGNWDGKTVLLELRKTKKLFAGNHPYYKDVIYGERKIISSAGAIEIDRITNFDMNSPEFMGIHGSLKNANQKQISFYPKNMCNAFGMIDLNFLDANKTQMRLNFEYAPGNITESCPYYDLVINQQQDFPINFPKTITLTKQ